MKKIAVIAPRAAARAAVLLGVFAIAAFPQGQPVFHVITYLTQLGEPVGILEGSLGIFYSVAYSPANWRAFSMTAQGSEMVLAAFPTSESPNAFIAGDDGLFYSTVDYRSKTASLFSISAVPNSKKVYNVQPIESGFTQNLPDGTLLGVANGPLDTFDLVTGDLNGDITTIYQFPAGETALYVALYATDGNYYGVSTLPDGSGYVYRSTPSGSVTKVYNFPSNTFSPSWPSSLIQANDGNLYGTTSMGGNGYGSIYKLTLAGQYTSLYSFPQSPLSQAPAPLIEASDGNLYGATSGGGSQLFRITKSGDLTILYTMNLYTDGECSCWLIQGSDGIFYGAASGGGLYGTGDIFSLNVGLPKPAPWVQHFYPSSGAVGTNVRIWGTNLLGASVQFGNTPATIVSNSGPTYVWATVPAGATTGPLTITTPGGTFTTSTSFTVQ